MAPSPEPLSSRALAALSWIAAGYVVALLFGYYLQSWDVRRHHLESAGFVLVGLLVSSVTLRRGIPDRQDTDARELPARALVPAFLAIAAVQYGSLVQSGLFADDYVLLEAARQGRLTVWDELFRPTIFVVWRTAATLTPHVAPVLHILNIVLHGINAYLVCLLAQVLGAPRWTAIAAGLLFVLFPGAVEAVAWPSGIQDVLMTTFVLGFLIIVLQPAATRKGTAAALVLLLAAVLTKETAVSAPALAAVLCLAIGRSGQTWTGIGAAALVVLLFVSVRFAVLPLPDDYTVSLTRYRLKEIVVRPFATLIAPVPGTGVGGTHSAAATLGLTLSALIVVTVTAAAARWRGTTPPFRVAVACAACVLLAIAPLHAYFYVAPDMHGSRYLYLPAAGWSILLAFVLRDTWPRHRFAGAVLVALVATAWPIGAVPQRRAWQDAASVRDRVLSAAAQIPLADCSRWTVAGLPDLVNGVPVFVNGFPEAMRRAGRREVFAPEQPGGNAACLMRWTGSGWVTASVR